VGENGRVAKYSTSGEPQQNAVAESHNHTLMDMVISMLSYSTLPISLWMEALKIAIYILNRIPSKSVFKNRTSCGLYANPLLITFEYGVVLLRLRYLTQMLVS
jgi:hypothetical protein